MLTIQSNEIMFLLAAELILLADLGHRGESYKDRCLLLRLHSTGNSWLRPSLVSPNLVPKHFSSLVWSESLKVRMSMKEILEGCVNYLWYLSFVICIIKVRFNKFWKRDWISMIFWNQIMIKKKLEQDGLRSVLAGVVRYILQYKI